MKNILKTDFDAFIESYSCPSYHGLRVNLLRCGPKEFMRKTNFELKSTPFAGEGFYCGKLSGRHPWHHAGVFYLQEPSSMSVVSALDPQPGMKILDLCAAPGGKSTMAAARLDGKGLIVCNEIIPSRANVLLSNIERCGVRNAVVTSENPAALCPKFPGFFDRVLVDAPCSGEGMFRREKEAVSQWSPESAISCAARQIQILSSAAASVAPGGILVYSTCTFSPEENEGVVERFLTQNPDFEPEEIQARFGRPAMPELINGRAAISLARRIFPQDGGEGHFVARLRKAAGSPNIKIPQFKPNGGSELFKAFYKSQFHGDLYGIPHCINGRVWVLPNGLPALDGLKVLRAGVLAGHEKGGRFEPEHALYMAAKPEDILNGADYPLNAAALGAFLHGEEISAPTGVSKGYCAVMADGFVTGFGKASNGMIKNHYPKGLRNLTKQPDYL